jgi:hypothetical protein
MRGPRDDIDGGTVTILSDVIASLGRLVRGELRLARAEAAEGVKAATMGLVKIAVAAILALVGLNVLAGAAVAGLAEAGVGPAWAAVIVGVGLCLIAVGLGLAGKAALTLKGVWPDRAVRGVGRDVAAVRAGLSDEGAQHG